eukprot:5845672-Lingulodinium_polyedra.AAC.1
MPNSIAAIELPAIEFAIELRRSMSMIVPCDCPLRLNPAIENRCDRIAAIVTGSAIAWLRSCCD